MKLLNTIQELIQEAEENLYLESLTNQDSDEIRKLEEKVEDSFNILRIYKNLF